MRSNRYPRTDPCPPLTSFQQQASAAAYTEADSLRWAYSEFDQACKKAIEMFKAEPPRPGKADWYISAASLKVAKAVRDLESVDELADLRLYEFPAPTPEASQENQAS